MPLNILQGIDAHVDVPDYEDSEMLVSNVLKDNLSEESENAPQSRTPSPDSQSVDSVILDLSCNRNRSSEVSENASATSDTDITSSQYSSEQEQEEMNRPIPNAEIDTIMDAFIKYYEGMIAKKMLEDSNLITLADDLSTKLENILISTDPNCVSCPKSQPESPEPESSSSSSQGAGASSSEPSADNSSQSRTSLPYAENFCDLYEGRLPECDPSLEGAVGFDPLALPGNSNKPQLSESELENRRIQDEAASVIITGKMKVIEALREISNTLVDMMLVDRYAARDTAETVMSSLEAALSMVRQGIPGDKRKDERN